jgi:hypothetical protein
MTRPLGDSRPPHTYVKIERPRLPVIAQDY